MKKMTSSKLKIIAYITMVIDHLGIKNNWLWNRYIGRIAFPLFILQFSHSVKLSKNRIKLEQRLLIWGLISWPFHWWLLGINQLNILLFFAFLSFISRKKLEKFLSFGCLIFEYDIFGLLIYLGEYYKKNYLIILGIGYYMVRWGVIYGSITAITIIIYKKYYPYKEGRKTKIFYLLYPLNFVIIKLLPI